MQLNRQTGNGRRDMKLVERYTLGGEEFLLRDGRGGFLCVNRSEARLIHSQLGEMLYPAPAHSVKSEQVADLTYAEGGCNGSADEVPKDDPPSEFQTC